MCTKDMPAKEVARLMNCISNCKFLEEEWQFVKRPYSRTDPPPASATMQILTTQSVADALEQGQEYLPDRSVSDADDPDLGAAAIEEDDATCGGGEAGGVEDWWDDDKEKRYASASLIGAVAGSTNTRRVDPCAELQAATQRNAQEAREEAEWQRVEAAKAPREEADAAAKAQAEAATKAQAEEAVSAPRTLDFGAASSSAPDAEASSAAPPKWTPGGGTSVLNRAANDVQAHLRAQGDALQQYTKEFLAMRTAIQDYHNIRAVAFNSHVRELAKRTANLADSRTQTALRAKEEECSKVAQECERLVKELADQADQHKAELKKLKEAEDSLTAEFETQRSNWAEREAILTTGYGEIEEMINDFFPGHVVAASRAIEARRDEQRAKEWRSRPTRPET
nr:uncharacterized protein LOC109759280 [Aegilops tauschii subsp. strangulata]